MNSTISISNTAVIRGNSIVISLLDSNNTPLSGKNIQYTLAGKTDNGTTDYF